MKRDDLLKQCRFYKGEREYPANKFNDTFGLAYWEAEEMYVNRFHLKKNKDFARQAIDDCIKQNIVADYVDVPTELLACLFATYCHVMGNDEYATAPYFELKFMPNYLARPL